MALYLVKIGNNKYIVKQGANTYLVSDGQTPTAQYTVTFNSMGGSGVASQTVVSGGTATRPTDPTYSGYSFVDWYEDSSYSGSPFNFSTPITADKTLYAKWSGASYAVTVTFASTSYATWSNTSKTAYTGDYLQISGMNVICKIGGSSGTTRWTVTLNKFPDDDTYMYTASITTTSRTVNSALTVSCTSARSINWPSSYDGTEFSPHAPDIEVDEVMSANMYSYARLTQLSSSGNGIDFYDGWAVGNGMQWYCAQLVTSSSNPYNYAGKPAIVQFDDNLQCKHWDSYEGGSANAYSELTANNLCYILICTAYNGTANDLYYNYIENQQQQYNLIQMLNIMIHDNEVEHVLVIDTVENYINVYK